MYRVMFYDFWDNIKKKKSDLFLSLLWLYIIARQIFFIAENYIESSSKTVIARFVAIMLMLLCMIALNLFLKHMPIRIYRTIYICPVDEKGKIKYLYTQLGLRIAFSLLIVCMMFKLCMGKVFPVNDADFVLMQIQLVFFFSLYLNLWAGIRALEAKEVDERGYRVRSDAEHALTVWWTCLFALEWTLFLTTEMLESSQAVIYIMGVVFTGINLFITLKYIKPVLLEICSYEKAYCPKPKKESVQYDPYSF